MLTTHTGTIEKNLLATGGIGAALFLMMGAGALPQAHAAAANGHAEVSNGAVRYTGAAGVNNLTIATSGDRLVFKDISPITVGADCFDSGTEGRFFVVSCLGPKRTNGTFKPIFVNAGAGDDVVTNDSVVSMNANGSSGNDLLLGSSSTDNLDDAFGKDILKGRDGDDNLRTDLSQPDGLTDTLEGGDGDDNLRGGANNDLLRGMVGNDTLVGNEGADTFDGGSGSDSVTYLDTSHDHKRVVATINGVADDGLLDTSGTPGTSLEKDNIQTNIETLIGGTGNDYLGGNDKANILIGNAGNDALEGFKGADVLDGQNGDDQLASNEFFGGPVADGAIDTLDGNTGTKDSCRVPFVSVEADLVENCEAVNQD
jgi:Ca2+-binding RTX toxin-like protein